MYWVVKKYYLKVIHVLVFIMSVQHLDGTIVD